MVALPVLNPAVKKPDENRVAFVSITNAAVSESLGTPSKKLKPIVANVIDGARCDPRKASHPDCRRLRGGEALGPEPMTLARVK